MGVDLYVACRDCRCAVHSEINARHEVAESLCELRWDPGLGAKAREWMWEDPDFGPESPVTQAILGFAEVHADHALGMVGYDDLCTWPWRGEITPLPSSDELLARLAAKKKDQRLEAARLARYRRDPDAVQPLLRVLSKDRAVAVRVEAARSLSSLANTCSLEGEGLEPVLAGLQAALEHKKEAVIAGAAEALGWVASGKPDPIEDHRPRVIERDPQLLARIEEIILGHLEGQAAAKGALLGALGYCASRSSLDLALAALSDPNPAVANAATRCLSAIAQGGLGDEAADALLSAAEKSLEAVHDYNALQSWGQILSACGDAGIGALKRLHLARGWFYNELTQALIPKGLTWPLPRQTLVTPVAHPEVAPAGIEFLPLPNVEGAPQGTGAHGVHSLASAGGRLAATNERGVAVVWDAASGEILRTFCHYDSDQDFNRRGRLIGLAFNADASLLAVGAERGEVWVWDLESGESRGSFKVGSCQRLLFAPAGHLLVGTTGAVLAYSYDGTRLQPYPGQVPGAIQGAALDPAGQRLAMWGRNSPRENGMCVEVVDIEGAHLATLEHGDCVRCLGWSPGGKRLATITQDRVLRIWDPAQGVVQVVEKIRTDYTLDYRADGVWTGGKRIEVDSVLGDEAPDPARPRAKRDRDTITLCAGDLSATLTRNSLVVHGGPEGRELWKLETSFYDVHTLEFDARGETLFVPLSGRGHPTPAGWVARLNARTGELVRRIGGAYMPGDFQISPDGALLATGGGEPLVGRQNVRELGLVGPATVWDLGTGRPLQVFRDERRNPAYCPGAVSLHVHALAFTPDGTGLAACSENGITLWDRASAEPRWRSTPWEVSNDFRQLWFTPDGRHLVAARTDDHLLILAADTGETLRVIRRFDRHRHPANIYFAPLPDGRLALGRHSVEIFDLPAALAQQAPVLSPLDLPAQSAPSGVKHLDGACLALGLRGVVAVGDDAGTTRVFEEDGTLRWERSALHRGGVSGVAFSPSGERVVSAGWDGALHVLDASTGEALASPPLLGATTYLYDVGFADEDHVFATSFEGVLALWDVATGRPLLATQASRAALAGPLLVGSADHAYKIAAMGTFPGKSPNSPAARRAKPECNLYLVCAQSLEYQRQVVLPSPPVATEVGVQAIAVAPDLRHAVALRLGDAVVAPLVDESALAHSLPGAFVCAAWSHDGRTLALGCAGGGIQLVSLSERGEAVQGELLPGEARRLAFEAEGKLIAVG